MIAYATKNFRLPKLAQNNWELNTVVVHDPMTRNTFKFLGNDELSIRFRANANRKTRISLHKALSKANDG